MGRAVLCTPIDEIRNLTPKAFGVNSPSSLYTRYQCFFTQPRINYSTYGLLVTQKCKMQIHRLRKVCPVACFYEMDTQVVISAVDCIDCMARVEVCPVHAIYADADVPTIDKRIPVQRCRGQPDQGFGSCGDHSPLRCAPHPNDRKKAWVIR